mmetsp:Transcript_22723/g.63430  ORF Transcript_22723/g.63430 Transcript_22723/m.63430 type:complete len:221 (+) Transcript_22723:716-1378(+)
MLRVKRRIKVRTGRALQLVHELQDGLLLHFKEPLDAFADVGHALLERQVRLIAQKLDHHVAPSERAHRDAPSLYDIALLCLLRDLGETQEDLHLVHQPAELGTAVDFDVECGDLDFHTKVIDVVVEPRKVLGGQFLEVLRPQCLVVFLERPQLVLEVHHRGQVQDALHDVCECRGEGYATVAGRAKDPLRVGLTELGIQSLRVLHCARLQVLQIRQHRRE